MRGVTAACTLTLLAAGCSGSHPAGVAIAPHQPPAPKTWPDYPSFPRHSCWARPTTSPSIMQVAPSYPVRAKRPVPPREVVRRLLARLGDRSVIRHIEIGAPPPRRVVRHVFPGKRPPKDAVWAYIDAPLASIVPSAHPTDERVREETLARWQAELVGGALRDDFCRAGGPTLAGWSLSRKMVDGGVSDGTFPLNQRFPNMSPRTFRARAALAGKRYGFRVESIRFLRPRQLAPIVVVSTGRDRKAFIGDVAAIVDVLDPKSFSGHRYGLTFEGIFFEARDDAGTFVRVDQTYRGAGSGRPCATRSRTSTAEPEMTRANGRARGVWGAGSRGYDGE
jgi:hypothetical protein